MPFFTGLAKCIIWFTRILHKQQLTFLRFFAIIFIAGKINKINFNTEDCRALKFILYLAGAVRICINKMRENMEESYDNC